jgi:hypothetical protein
MVETFTLDIIVEIRQQNQLIVEFRGKLTGNQQSCSGSADAVPFHTAKRLHCTALFSIYTSTYIIATHRVLTHGLTSQYQR